MHCNLYTGSNQMMMVDSIQMRIWEGLGSALACPLVAVESNFFKCRPYCTLQQAKAWVEDDW